MTKSSNMYRHLLQNAFMGLILIITALYGGMLGYHYIEKMSWLDSFLNAAMILSGMGPVSLLKSTGGKLFAGFYALFSGLAFIAIVVMMLSPIMHKFFRTIHLESTRDKEDA